MAEYFCSVELCMYKNKLAQTFPVFCYVSKLSLRILLDSVPRKRFIILLLHFLAKPFETPLYEFPFISVSSRGGKKCSINIHSETMD